MYFICDGLSRRMRVCLVCCARLFAPECGVALDETFEMVFSACAVRKTAMSSR